MMLDDFLTKRIPEVVAFCWVLTNLTPGRPKMVTFWAFCMVSIEVKVRLLVMITTLSLALLPIADLSSLTLLTKVGVALPPPVTLEPA